MGCLQLHIKNEPRLSLAYSKKVQKPLKISVSYYPFGLQQQGYNDVVTSNSNSMAEKFAFGGKEFGEELGLNWYDVSARNYDPAIGRWMNIDPLAELMTRHSPYNYAFDNPIYFIDPDGRSPFGFVDPKRQKAKSNGAVRTVHDLGATGITGVGFTKKSNGTYETQVFITETTNQVLSDPESGISKNNPGLSKEVEAHEEGHGDQFEAVLFDDNFYIDVDLGDGNIWQGSGDLDVIGTAFVNEVLDPLKGEEGASEKIQTALKQFTNSLSAAAHNKVNGCSDHCSDGNLPGVEVDAIQNAQIKLEKQGIEPKYQRTDGNTTPIYDENGNVLPSNTSGH